MSYKKLIQARSDLLAESRKLLDGAGETGLSEEQAARDDEIHASVKQLDAQIARYERQLAAERVAPAVADGNVDAARRGLSSIEGLHDRIEDDPKLGFRNVGEFATAVRQAYTPGGQLDERLRVGAAPSNFHYEVGSDEGAMVPPAFREAVWNAVEDYSAIWNDLNPEPTSSNAVDFLRDESTPWGSTGVQARWRSESSQMTATKLLTDPSTMRLHELYAFVTATNDLLNDAPRLNNRLTQKAGQAIAYSIDDAAVNGDGVGKPLGWGASAALVTVAKESAQVAATVVAANVSKMYARLLNPGQGIWYVNQSVLSQLFTMTIGDQPVWLSPNGNLRDNPDGGTLFGRPVKTFQGCETLGTVGDIYFVNPMGYYAIQRQNQPEFAQSIHLYFDYNMTAFRWTVRVGGQPFLSAPVSPAKGSDTLSHFVTLATRS